MPFKSDAEYVAACHHSTMSGFSMEERLHKLFKVPRKIFVYDSSKPLNHLFKFEASAVLLCIKSYEFWFFLGINIVLSVIYFEALDLKAESNLPIASGWPKASSTLLTIPTAILSFLTVFFINAAYKRYLTQYLKYQSLIDALKQISLVFRTHFNDGRFDGSKEMRHTLLKLLVAALTVAVAGLPQNRSIRLHLWAFDYLLENDLLTTDQVEALRPLMSMADGRFAMTEIFTWISRNYWSCLGEGNLELETKGMLGLGTKIYEARKCVEYLYAQAAAPIPYVWFNLLSIYTSAYLLVLSYLFVFFNGPYYGTIIYTLILITFLSLRELGCALSDPFGQDEVDIPAVEMSLAFGKEIAQLADMQVLKQT